MKRLLIVALLFVPATAHAEPVRYRDVVFGEVAVQSAIPYATVTNGEGEQVVLALDLYEPVGDDLLSRPAIVFAHGGGFTGGRRDDPGIVGLARTFAGRGYVTASISYRIRPAGMKGSPTMQDLIVGSLAGQLPDAMHDAQLDMQAAIRFLRDNASAYGIDPDVIAAGGVSAGASMALEAAYNPDDDGDVGTTPSTILAAVSISGATDPRRIEPGAPPVAMFNGTHDSTAPYPTAVMACEGARLQGNLCALHSFVGSGHDLSAENETIIRESAALLYSWLIA